MHGDPLRVSSMIGSPIVELRGRWAEAHLGVTHLAPSAAAASQIVMDHNPVADFDMTDPRPYLDDLTAGFMPPRLQLAQVPSLASGSPIGAKIAPAETRGAHLDDDLGETGGWFRKFPEF
jgi:hypothetical protein